MIEKLFIVAAGNEAVYQSLQRGLAGEDNVAITAGSTSGSESLSRWSA